MGDATNAELVKSGENGTKVELQWPQEAQEYLTREPDKGPYYVDFNGKLTTTGGITHPGRPNSWITNPFEPGARVTQVSEFSSFLTKEYYKRESRSYTIPYENSNGGEVKMDVFDIFYDPMGRVACTRRSVWTFDGKATNNTPNLNLRPEMRTDVYNTPPNNPKKIEVATITIYSYDESGKVSVREALAQNSLDGKVSFRDAAGYIQTRKRVDRYVVLYG